MKRPAREPESHQTNVDHRESDLSKSFNPSTILI